MYCHLHSITSKNQLIEDREDDEDIVKIVRLGARKEKDRLIKSRPLRFSVNNKETKWKLLKASMALRSCDDELFNTIYMTPDLTQKQRDEAFKLGEKAQNDRLG